MPDIFLSYSREDQATVRRYAEALEREGFNVWWDAALNPGETFDQVTEQALKEARAVVVLWSKHSVTSRWVRSEATQADRFGTLVPVMIEPCDRPILFELAHTTDLTGWNGDRNTEDWRSFVASLRRLVAKGSHVAASPAAPAAAAAPASAPAPAVHVRRRAFAWAIAAMLVAIGAALLWQFQASRPMTSAARATTDTSRQAGSASVAVLPFRDMSQGRDQEYFADGVTEEILNTLAGLKNLKVTARTSAFAFKGKDVDLRTVGKTLGVQHILEGSIRKDGDKLRITAQLIDAESDAHLWSKTYDRPLHDIFAVQEEIARSVAEALQVSLGVGFGAKPGMTRDVEAYDAYLQGSALWPRFTPDSRRRGVELLQHAVDRDPEFAYAWKSLANFCASMPVLAEGNPGEDSQGWLRRSDAAFGQFARLMDGTPQLHQALAERSIQAGRYAEAARQFRETAEASARLGTGWEEWQTAPLLAQVGRPREAIVVLERALARDPLFPPVVFYLAHAYSATGNVQAAYATFERGPEFGDEGRNIFLGGGLVAAMGARDKVQVRRWLDAQIDSAPDTASPQVNTQLRSLLDRPSEALALLREMVRDPSMPALNLSIMAIFMAYFGGPEDALEILRSPRLGAPAGLAAVDIWGPVFRDVRRLPAFKDFVRDIGLVDYWREFGWGDFCKPVGEGDFECR